MTDLAPRPQIDVSVVVPVYGGTGAIPELADRLAATMREAGLRWELILVDDRGQAGAWAAIRGAAQRHPEVRGLRLGRNFGQHAATMCGIVDAKGTWVVTMDDDLEHPPEAVPSLVAAGDADYPLVYGVFERRTHAGYRNLSSEIMRRTLKRAFPDLNESYTSFRAIHRSVAQQLGQFGLNRPYIDGMLSWITSSVRTVEVRHGSREHGHSTYTMRKLLSHAINIFVTFSHLPLRMATYSGLALAAFSFLWILYIVYERMTGAIASPGYASLMSVVLFACGIQLILLGVLGEYVGRLMGAAYRKPVFVVVNRTDEPVVATTRTMDAGSR